MPDNVKHWFDAGAIGTAVGTLLGVLPQIAAGLSIVWLLIQIGDWAFKKWQAHRQSEPQ